MIDSLTIVSPPDTEALWGTDPAERFTHAHDFRYALWLHRFDLMHEYFQTAIDELAQNPHLSADDQKKLKTRQSNYRLAHLCRASWSDRLQPLPHPVVCEWCGRSTTLAYLAVNGHFRHSRMPDYLRGLGSQLTRLCPACGFGTDSSYPKAIDGVPPWNRDGHIVRDAHGVWQLFAAKTPWYQLPWDSAPALWIRFYPGPTATWMQKAWLTQSVPTLDPHCAVLWVNGTNYVVNGMALSDIARTFAQLLATWRSVPFVNFTAFQVEYEAQVAPLRPALTAIVNHDVLAHWLKFPAAQTVWDMFNAATNVAKNSELS